MQVSKAGAGVEVEFADGQRQHYPIALVRYARHCTARGAAAVPLPSG